VPSAAPIAERRGLGHGGSTHLGVAATRITPSHSGETTSPMVSCSVEKTLVAVAAAGQPVHRSPSAPPAVVLGVRVADKVSRAA